MANPSPMPDFNVPLVDPDTGLINHTWMRYFLTRVGSIGPSPIGVPAGGTTGEVLAKNSNADYDDSWQPLAGIGVTSFNTRTGAVTLNSGDVTTALGYTPGTGNGTVTAVSVASANGLAGTSSGGATPALTLSTSVTGILKGNGTAISAAVGDTDYQNPISLTTTGTSGAATFSGDVLNVPNYAVNLPVGTFGVQYTTSNISTSTLAALTTTALYQINAYALCSLSGTAGTLTVTVGWTDDYGAQTKALISGLSLTTQGNYAGGTLAIEALASTNITYAASISGGTGAPQYNLYLTANEISPFSPISPSGFFQAGSYTGTGATQSVTLSRNFQPDLVLIFDLHNATAYYNDSTTGVGTAVNIYGGTTSVGFTSFNSNGFTLSNNATLNGSGRNYIYFAWKKGVNFFDIKTYTGTGANKSVNHNLTSAPAMMWLTDTSTANQTNAVLYTQSQGGTNPNAAYYSPTFGQGSFVLTNSVTAWENIAPGAAAFTVGANNATNYNGDPFINYLFGALAGSCIVGTYTGNNNVVGPTISGMGFTPSCVFITNAGTTNAYASTLVYGNTASVALSGAPGVVDTTNYINLVSGGFNVVTTNNNFNTNTQVYQYVAWA